LTTRADDRHPTCLIRSQPVSEDRHWQYLKMHAQTGKCDIADEFEVVEPCPVILVANNAGDAEASTARARADFGITTTWHRLNGFSERYIIFSSPGASLKLLVSNSHQRGKQMEHQALNLAQKLSLIDEHWSPRVIAEMNDYQFKLVKIGGDFIWHQHPDTDETFIVLEGSLRIDFRDGQVELEAGEMYVVPRGIEHKPFAEAEAHLLVIEPRGVVNTGDSGGDLTAPNDQWI
jgi:mannose-6-phosphate isomerase-like protein (cupin superfamily)